MKKIILIDDNKDFVEVEKEFIEFLIKDVSCITFTRAFEVLFYLREGNKADVLITDYEMPELNGFDLAKIVNGEFQEIQIILSSGNDVKSMEKISFSLGLENDVKIISKSNLEALIKII